MVESVGIGAIRGQRFVETPAGRQVQPLHYGVVAKRLTIPSTGRPHKVVRPAAGLQFRGARCSGNIVALQLVGLDGPPKIAATGGLAVLVVTGLGRMPRSTRALLSEFLSSEVVARIGRAQRIRIACAAQCSPRTRAGQ